MTPISVNACNDYQRACMNSVQPYVVYTKIIMLIKIHLIDKVMPTMTSTTRAVLRYKSLHLCVQVSNIIKPSINVKIKIMKCTNER